MSSPAHRSTADAAEREEALDPRQSFLVQAPAGSGKTELLIQRFLRLLSEVERPEAIVAVTFTRKAAGEMVRRITDALREAQEQPAVFEPHQQRTRTLAEAALQRDRQFGWNILEQPSRLRVQTIDSLCVAIASEMPWLARLGGMPRIEEKAGELYEDAARRTVLLAGDAEHGGAVSTVLGHLDNDAGRARDLIAMMLGTREQWLELAVQTEQDAREPFEEAVERLIAGRCENADRLIPTALREPWITLATFSGRTVDAWPRRATHDVRNRLDTWKKLIDFVCTKDGGWRKQFTVSEGFPAANRAKKQDALRFIADLKEIPGLREALCSVRDSPPPVYSGPQWDVTLALLRAMKLAAAELRNVFREHGATDFAEIGMAARHALGDFEQTTDLAFRLDSRIEHLLVDEFQDTSRGQIDLIGRLTAHWQPGDGRTLFLVGDPMQSIYRFRQADVGIFLETRERGMSDVRLKPLNLVCNYRSHAALVDRVNEVFEELFPTQEDAATGAVRFHRSEASRASSEGIVEVHGFAIREDRREAEKVVELIREAQTRAPAETVAVLVRARTHLPAIVELLKSQNIPFRAVEIDPLVERPVVLDLLSLTRAMLHRADRIAWLAILRAPWCGLGLADLEKIGGLDGNIWDTLQGYPGLSGDGSPRVERLRRVLEEAFEQQGRWPLRRWVERAWIQLGGPACLGVDEDALSNASAYFDHLEARQVGADLPNVPQFETGLKDLFAQPDANASDQLQIMTIHKAKGLEFDTVIVPGLGRTERIDDSSLVLFHEWGDGERVERLLAPIPQPGGDDPLYECLRKIESRKNNLERVRLLYVAATRAKRNLHLLGQANAKNGEPVPAKRSMLGDLWPALSEGERHRFRRAAETELASTGSPPGTPLGRLPVAWTPPDLPMDLSPGETPVSAHQPSFEWVGDGLRIAGTVVHELLRRGTVERPPALLLRRLLAHEGMIPSEAGAALDRVMQALERVRNSPRAGWILAAHRDARSEYAISGLDGGEIVRGKVDRTFVDEQGIRWIIDFKTSAHEGGSLDEFLDNQQRRYGEQLARYGRLLKLLGQPVRVGLYFPLLDEWREWPV